MPQSYSQTEEIHATPKQIHDWLENWDNIRAWMGPSLVSIEMLSEHPADAPMCVGMRFKETRQMGKMKAKANIEVIEHGVDKNGVFRHCAFLDDGCNQMMCEYTYEPTEEGTHASFLMYNAPNKWWTKAMCKITGSFMMKMCAKQLSDHLHQLKDLVENDQSQTAQA